MDCSIYAAAKNTNRQQAILIIAYCLLQTYYKGISLLMHHCQVKWSWGFIR